MKSGWQRHPPAIALAFDQPDAKSSAAQEGRITDALADKLPKIAEHLVSARADLLAFTAFPKQIWRQFWSNSHQERLNKEIRRCTDVIPLHDCRSTSLTRSIDLRTI